jgi:deoxyribonuclease V
MDSDTTNGAASARLVQQRPFDWSTPPGKAVLAQQAMASQVLLCPLPAPSLVAGIDLAYSVGSGMGYAAIVVMKLPKFKKVEIQTERYEIRYPYRPGLLAMREGPLTAAVLKKLTCRPDVILFDGAGIAHPRRFGVASHFGVLFDIPTVGCAKTPLITVVNEPGPKRGDFSPMMMETAVLGAALRTRPGVKPVYVSPGHRADLTGAIDVVLATSTKYRLPEPIRQAHRLANELRAEDRKTS